MAAQTAILYHYPWSICSIMVRYSLALRGQPKGGELRVEEKEVNIGAAQEQLQEHFLCDINALGEVPVLAVAGQTPMPDSLAITRYLASVYPSLIPTAHEKEINELLKELHNISFFSLTFAGKPGHPQASLNFLKGKLDEDISERYRKAIEFKIKRIENNKMGHLTEKFSEDNEANVKVFCEKIVDLLSQSKTGWLFGLQHPSALDAHVIVFIARVTDIGRGELIPERMKEYGFAAMKGPQWQAVQQGRTTVPPRP